MTDRVSIRSGGAEDVATIVAFNRAMAWETEGRDLPLAHATAGVEGLFLHPHYGFYLVAEASGEPVGSLLVTFEWSDWRNGLIWWIQSVYVKPEWRRRGIYRMLYTAVKQRAQGEGKVRGFRLYVEKDNRIAQQTYAALGMREAPYKIFQELEDTD